MCSYPHRVFVGGLDHEKVCAVGPTSDLDGLLLLLLRGTNKTLLAVPLKYAGVHHSVAAAATVTAAVVCCLLPLHAALQYLYTIHTGRVLFGSIGTINSISLSGTTATVCSSLFRFFEHA